MMADYNPNHQMRSLNNIFNKMNLDHINYNKNLIYDETKTISIYFESEYGALIVLQAKLGEKVGDLINRYRQRVFNYNKDLIFIFNGKFLDPNLTVSKVGCENSRIFVRSTGFAIGGGYWYDKEINIKFIQINKNIYYNNHNYQLIGLLKLCLLKEISSKLSVEQIQQFPQIISCILRILKKGYIETSDDIKETIKELLTKMKGSNIINFSEYVDEIIYANHIKQMTCLLNKGELKQINDISFRLSKYNEHIQFFNKEFEKAKKESIFEFSIISLIIIEREDFKRFDQERQKCPNRVEKILFHGTGTEPISCILTDQFKKSVDRHYQHGKGVYFTDFLDYCWFYGGDVSNRANKNKIPNIGDCFTLIACSVYYNKKGFRKVNDYKYTPKKNEINFAYAGAHFETLINYDNTKFLGTEYVIWDLDQICPFISAKLKRQEFCVIWRDNNFSSAPVYNNQFDEIFKKFLDERIKYIKKMAKFNIYPCESSEIALNLVERKKYNKIILISNVGNDLGGKKFVDKARKIIGNDVIALFFAYNTAHLDWIKKYKNALFSKGPKFYETYLECFESSFNCKDKIIALKESLENHYKVKFNFDENFLDYPNFKESGKYSDLSFNY